MPRSKIKQHVYSSGYSPYDRARRISYICDELKSLDDKISEFENLNFGEWQENRKDTIIALKDI